MKRQQLEIDIDCEYGGHECITVEPRFAKGSYESYFHGFCVPGIDRFVVSTHFMAMAELNICSFKDCREIILDNYKNTLNQLTALIKRKFDGCGDKWKLKVVVDNEQPDNFIRALLENMLQDSDVDLQCLTFELEKDWYKWIDCIFHTADLVLQTRPRLHLEIRTSGPPYVLSTYEANRVKKYLKRTPGVTFYTDAKITSTLHNFIVEHNTC